VDAAAAVVGIATVGAADATGIAEAIAIAVRGTDGARRGESR
jgi:hypothetical protein